MGMWEWALNQSLIPKPIFQYSHTPIVTKGMVMSLIASETAEWICTRCGATNRILVRQGATTATDRCVTCHTAHELKEGSRPVRWDARLK